MIQTSYLEKVYYPNEFARLIKKMTAALKTFEKKNPFDAIAFRGTSGAAVAYPLSIALKIPLICVRKGNSHSYMKVEGCIDAMKYIIVDDFIESGKTMKAIVNSIKKVNKKSVPIQIFLYGSLGDPSTKSWEKIPIKRIR
jgi:adenine/guanine phosphoribosyltransferase-like PRPP-binding protein